MHNTLLGLDMGGADNFAPLVGFVGDKSCEIIRRAAYHTATQISEARSQTGVCEGRVNLSIELADDLDGSALGRAESDPVTRLEARHKFAHGRYLWQCI